MVYDLEQRRVELQLTQEEVAGMVGVTKATVSKWEKGDIANMKRDKIVKLAKALKISPLLLVGIKPEVETVDISEEIALPYLGTIAAGHFEGSYSAKEEMSVPSRLLKENSKHYFILKVNGDSMNKVISNGHFVVVLDFNKATNMEFNTNDILIVRNGSEFTMKRVRKTDTTLHLEPDSYIDEFKIQSYKINDYSELQIIGKVVYSFRNF